MDTRREQRSDARLSRARAEEIGAHGDDHSLSACDGRRDQRRELRDVRFRETGVEQFLELVDDDDVGVASTGECVSESGDRRRSRAEDDDGVTTRPERGHETGQHQRGLPAPGRPGDGEERRPGEPRQRGLDVGVAPEELLGIVRAERLQAAIRAVRTHEQVLRWRVERGILVQDRRLERHEFCAGLDAELVGQPLPRAPQCGEGVGLTAAPVERRDEDRPPPFPKGIGSDEALSVRDDGPVLAGLEPCSLQVLLGGLPDLPESLRFRNRRRPLTEVRVRHPAPECGRSLEHVDGPHRVAVRAVECGPAR